MKQLIEYIQEARETIKVKIPWELFENFMKDAIIDMEYDDSEYWEPMRELVTKEYGEKVWRWFYGWCEGYMPIMKNTTIKDFYNLMKIVPLDRFNRVLGAGSEGIVLDLHGDKVIKLCYGEEFDKSTASFYQYCKEHNSKVFPKVYKLGKNWCVMEKLKVLTPKCKDYIDVIYNKNKQNKYNFISDIKNGVSPEIVHFNKLQKEVYHWCVDVKDEMEQIKYIEYPMDLSINNIGERGNGDIIFFDL